mgnify:CR=1 FL=1
MFVLRDIEELSNAEVAEILDTVGGGGEVATPPGAHLRCATASTATSPDRMTRKDRDAVASALVTDTCTRITSASERAR